MRILFVRHAQSTANIRNALDTAAPGASLSPLGREQAEALPTALKAEVDEPITAVYASPLRRTQETAEPLARSLGVPIRVRAGLQEVLAGDLEGRGDHESIQQYLANAQAWASGDLDAHLPGGETGHEVLARMDGVVEEAVRSGAEVVAMVSHGCAIWTWVVARAGNVGAGVRPPNAMSNTALVAVEGDLDRGWHVTSWEGTVLHEPGLVDTEHDGPVSVPPAPAARRGPAGSVG